MLALGVRALAFVVVNAFLYDGQLEHPDSVFYHDQALELLRPGGSFSVGELLTNKAGYAVFVASMYRTFGFYPFLVAFVNVFCGAVAVVIGYRLAWRVFGHETARLAGILLAIDPAAVYWSTQLLKDTVLTLAAIIAVYLVLGRRRIRASEVAGLVVTLLIMLVLRPEFAFATMMGLAGIGILNSRGRSVMAILGTAVVTLAFVASIATSWWMTHGVETASGPQSVVAFVDNVRAASSAPGHVEFFEETVPGTGFGSPWELALGILKSPVYYLFAPFVWQARSTYELLYVVPGLWWYGMGALGIFGILKARKNRAARHLGVLVLALGLPVVVLFTSPAAILRWRLQSATLLVLFAAYGIGRFRRRNGSPALIRPTYAVSTGTLAGSYPPAEVVPQRSDRQRPGAG
ncbi:MAG: ArnT family glycosyltransferase [Actinomycetota bacterium]